MNSKELRADIETLYFKSLGSSNIDCIVWLDAVKSILGINLDSINIDLFNMLVSEFNENHFSHSDIKHYNTIPSAISLYGLEKALLDKDLNNSLENIYYLSRVSDGAQILEFLLEFSLKNCSSSYKYIWHMIRMQNFLNGKYMLETLNKAVLIILSEKFNPLVYDYNQKISWVDFLSKDFYAINDFLLYYTIYNSDLIRIDLIQPLLVCKLLKLKACHDNNLKFNDKQIDLGRKWIFDYLYRIDKDMLNFDMIIFLNNIRSCLMLSDDELEKQYLWSYLNNRI